MRAKVLGGARIVYFVVSEIIGLAGVPSDLKVWECALNPYLDLLDIWAVRAFLVVSGLVVVTSPWWKPHIVPQKRDQDVPQTSANDKTLELADLNRWKHVQRLKLYQVAELCGGVSPRESTTGSNDTARAVYSELYAALTAGDLKGSDPPHRVSSWTYIERKNLQKYFTGRDDSPEFLKD